MEKLGASPGCAEFRAIASGDTGCEAVLGMQSDAESALRRW